MKAAKRLLSRTFWYKVSLNFTIWKTIRKMDLFSNTEIKSIKKEYARLKSLNGIFITDIHSEYHVSWCSIILSIYKACINKCIEPEKAISITDEIIFQNMKPDVIAGYIRKALDKSNDPFAYMVKTSKKQEDNFFGQAFTFYCSADNNFSYHLKVSNCFYYNYFKKNNTPELMQIACRWDMISWSKGISQEKHKFTFKRPVTLGLDNKDCEFIFERAD